jgi:protein ImuA
MPSLKQTELMASLRAQIAALETSPRVEDQAMFTLGLKALDERLPGGGLARRGVHEVMAAAYGDMGAAIGFAAALAVRASFAVSGNTGPIVWCQQGWGSYDLGELYGPGLAAFGIDPSRLLLVNPAREPDMLWALEECVRAGALAAVVGEVPAVSRHFDLRASRRLHLGAEDTGTPLILLRGHMRETEETLSPSAALTRWRVAAAPAGTTTHVNASEAACWHVDLDKCKGGAPFSMPLVWEAEARAFVEAGTARPKVSVSARQFSVLEEEMREAG